MSNEPKRIVLVDDDEDLLFATGLALSSGGFAPQPFRTCDEAVTALTDAPAEPWAILLDMHLAEGMSPATFIGWLRDHGLGGVPVLIVTASPDAATVARSLGATGHLSKPYSISDLLDRVRSIRG